MASTLALPPIRRQLLSGSRGDQRPLLMAAALFIVVLIVEAAIIALAATNIADIASLYTITT